jgi:hypothetical protein
MKHEASVLQQNPMLIQKIIAERLSDKLQIMMVPMDGKNFFASDVMRPAFSNATGNGNGGLGGAPDNDEDSGDPASMVAAAAKRKPGKRP